MAVKAHDTVKACDGRQMNQLKNKGDFPEKIMIQLKYGAQRR